MCGTSWTFASRSTVAPSAPCAPRSAICSTIRSRVDVSCSACGGRPTPADVSQSSTPRLRIVSRGPPLLVAWNGRGLSTLPAPSDGCPPTVLDLGVLCYGPRPSHRYHQEARREHEPVHSRHEAANPQR